MSPKKASSICHHQSAGLARGVDLIVPRDRTNTTDPGVSLARAHLPVIRRRRYHVTVALRLVDRVTLPQMRLRLPGRSASSGRPLEPAHFSRVGLYAEGSGGEIAKTMFPPRMTYRVHSRVLRTTPRKTAAFQLPTEGRVGAAQSALVPPLLSQCRFTTLPTNNTLRVSPGIRTRTSLVARLATIRDLIPAKRALTFLEVDNQALSDISHDSAQAYRMRTYLTLPGTSHSIDNQALTETYPSQH